MTSLDIVWKAFKESFYSEMGKPAMYCSRWSFVSSVKGHGEIYQTDIQVKLDFLEVQAWSVATLSTPTTKFFVHHCSFR